MKRNFGLDIARAFSIWLVLLQHGGFNIPYMKPLQIGGIGVEIFFVMSGFLIGGIMLREIDRGRGIGKTLGRFWVRRWFRILPLYYLMLGFKFLLIDRSIGWNLLYYIGFLQNNTIGIDWYPVTWSLVIEEWFYLFAPVFMLALHKLFKNPKVLLAMLVAFIVSVNFARLGYVLWKDVPYQGVNGNPPFRFDSLFLGVILAYLRHRKFPIYEKLEKNRVFFAGLTLMLGYLAYYFSLCYPEHLIQQSLIPRTFGFFILPFSIMLMLPRITAFHTLEQNNLLKKGIFTFVTWTSIFTYAIYLIHPFWFKMVFLNKKFIFHLSPVNFLLAVLATYITSFLVYHAFEKPILKIRDRLTKKKK